MDFTIPIRESKFHNKSFTELVNKKRVKELLKFQLLEEDQNEYAQLQKYAKMIRYNKKTVKYQHSKNGVNVGRVFANNGLSLQSLRRKIRHYLAHDIYDELDIENCYFTILNQLCEKNLTKNEYKYISLYTKHREKKLKEIACDREKSKALFLMLLHGGTLDGWREKFNEPLVNIDLDDFIKEIKKIGQKIHLLNPKLKKEWWGQTVSVVLQYYENLILEYVYQYLENNKFDVSHSVLCFDGIMIPKSKNNNQKLLDNLNHYVLEKTGFNIQFKWKPMSKPTFNPKKQNNNNVASLDDIIIDTTDDTLALLFKRFFSDKFIYVGDTFYFYNDCFWIYDDKHFIISSYIAVDLYTKLDGIITDRINLKYTDELKKLKIKLLNMKNDKKIKSIINRLKAHLFTNDVVLDNNPYLLVFNNGVYDLKSFTFRKTTPNEYITNSLSTNYDYKPINNDLMNTFIENYIDKVFINDKEDKLVFLKLFATCLLGKRFKKYIIANGSGDNAKTGFRCNQSLCILSTCYML